MNDSLLTPKQVAELLTVPVSWIYGRSHAGTLPFPPIRVGSYLRFRADDVRAFINGQAEKEMTAVRMTPCRLQRAREILQAPSDMSVYMACRRGQIPYRKIGKRLVFFEEELFGLLDRMPGLKGVK